MRLFLEDHHSIQLAAADVEIAVDDHGRPRVAASLERELSVDLALSISHAGGNAVALATGRDGRLGVGIDIECFDDKHEGLADAALNRAERALLDLLPPESRQRGDYGCGAPSKPRPRRSALDWAGPPSRRGPGSRPHQWRGVARGGRDALG